MWLLGWRPRHRRAGSLFRAQCGRLSPGGSRSLSMPWGTSRSRISSGLFRAFRVEWTAEDLSAHSLASGSTSSPMKFAAALTPADKPSIAVLPFQNMSGDPDREYFAEGLTQDIASALSRMPWFVAIGHSLSNAYKSGPINARIATREFRGRASYVLTGSVRKAGNEVTDCRGARGHRNWNSGLDRTV